MNIPLIIPVYNQLTYLRNALNWWHWYYPENEVFIVDNGSTYEPLIHFLGHVEREYPNVSVSLWPENTFIPNLQGVVGGISAKYPYYCISDADIMPHPSTPPNFLEIWKMYIESGYHHVGFNLITDGLPKWLNEREMIIGNEKELLIHPVEEYNGYIGYRAPIDTTFALYSSGNGGWQSPMNGADWSNCLRLFEAFHFGWYQHQELINPEMENYFATSKYRVPGQPSAGSNNNRPKKYQ